MPADCSKGEVQRRRRRGLQPLTVETYDDQFVGRIWPQSRSRAVICCPLQIFCQILRCCFVAALGHQNGQSKLDSFRDSQPVKFFKQRSNAAVVLATAIEQSCCGVEHWLWTFLHVWSYSPLKVKWWSGANRSQQVGLALACCIQYVWPLTLLLTADRQRVIILCHRRCQRSHVQLLTSDSEHDT